MCREERKKKKKKIDSPRMHVWMWLIVGKIERKSPHSKRSFGEGSTMQQCSGTTAPHGPLKSVY